MKNKKSAAINAPAILEDGSMVPNWTKPETRAAMVKRNEAQRALLEAREIWFSKGRPETAEHRAESESLKAALADAEKIVSELTRRDMAEFFQAKAAAINN